MKIIPIFAKENTPKGLFSIKYDDEDEDEFNKCVTRWFDTEYLYNFFQNNETNLNNGYYENYIPISDAIAFTREEAYELFETISKLSTSNYRGSKNLSSYFRPLIGVDAIHEFLQEEKAASRSNLRCLRLYAIKISDETYIITGGGIKIVSKMSQSPELLEQLESLKTTRMFLKKHNVFCQEDFEKILKLEN